MNLDKLFGSRTKTDILKYLVFRRQGISMRAFETDLTWSFPAIKKQIEQLDESWMITIRKDQNSRSISLTPGLDGYIKALFLYSLRTELVSYFSTLTLETQKCYLWKLFGKELEVDLVLIYQEWVKEQLTEVKEQITEIFRKYLIELVNVSFMSCDEFDKRYRLADKFVLQLMRQGEEVEIIWELGDGWKVKVPEQKK